ncbi:MAG TPA: site-specific integrase [Terracidiphilus sp.]
MKTTKLEKVVKRPGYEREARAVTLVLRVKHEDKWRRYPAAYAGNGRVKPGYAVVDRVAVKFDHPAYEVRYIEDRRPHYRAAGRDAVTAEAERKRIEVQSGAVAVAEAAGVKVAEITERKTLRAMADEYYLDAHHREAFEAETQARQVMPEFLKSCPRTLVDEVTRQDVLRFHAALRKRGLSDRTVANKHARLRAIMRFAGVDVKSVFPPEPGYDERLPTVYSPDQIKGILVAAEGRMRIVIGMAMKLGLREGELACSEYTDIYWSESVFRVRSKPQFNHRIKDSEERDIPIPADLLGELGCWREARPERNRGGLIVPTSNGTPDGKLLVHLKRLAARAGLGCEKCDGCKNNKWGCREWTLHRFRRNYLTTLLRNGLDLRTVQSYAGHSDMGSTMRYLRPAEGKDAQARINAVNWD